MASLAMARALTLIAALLWLPSMLLADPEEPAASPDRQARLLEDIRRVQANDGVHSAALLEPLMALILLYTEGGRESEAVVALDRAVQVVRVNRGLYSLDQAPLIRQLIEIEERRGNFTAAWDLEQGLLALLRRHPDDLRTVPHLREMAAKQLAILEAFLAGKQPPQVVIGCYYKVSMNSNTGTCSSGSAKTVVHGLLGEAQRHYSDAIGTLLRNGRYGDDELHALETELLRVVVRQRPFDTDPRQSHLTHVPRFAQPEFYEPWQSRVAAIAELARWTPSSAGAAPPTGSDMLEPKHAAFSHSYYRGRQILRRLYAYTLLDSKGPLEQAAAVVRLADWELMYSHHGQAMARYERAHAMLQAANREAAIEETFSPAAPVVLPAFEKSPFALDEAREPTGHIEVAFEITKHGRARHIAFLGGENADAADRDRLENLIATSTFRPRVADGRLAESAPVRLRYRLYD